MAGRSPARSDQNHRFFEQRLDLDALMTRRIVHQAERQFLVDQPLEDEGADAFDED